MELKPIAELADVITGFPFDGARYDFEGIRVVRGENVTIGALRWDTTKCWKDEFEHVEYYSLKAGDVVVGMDGSRVGHNRARVEKSDLPLLLAQRVACLRAKPGVDPAYLYYLFKSDRFPEYVERIQTGSTVPHISKDQIEAFMVPCPDKKTQQGIGSVLSSLDAKITLNQRINAELEAMAKLLYDYWFVQFDFPNAKGKPYKSSGGRMVYNSMLKREVPQVWEIKSLGELVDCFDNERVPLSRSQREKRPGHIPYYGATGIFDYIDEHIYEGEYVLIAEDGSIMDDAGWPIVQFITGKSWINNHAHVLRSKVDGHNEFFFQRLKHIPVITVMTGSIQKKITAGNLLGYRIAYPGDELVKQFCEIVRSMRESVFNIEAQNQELTALRDWLLPLLMNGQVRVSTSLDVTPAKGKMGLAMAAEPIATYGKPAPKKLNMEDRAALNGWVIHVSNRDKFLGRTKAEKLEHILEGHLGNDHQREPVRFRAGPLDKKGRELAEQEMQARQWGIVLEKELPSGDKIYPYRAGIRIKEAVVHAETMLGAQLGEAKRIVSLMRDFNTHQCEVLVTLYAAWNDLLHFSKPITNKAIITEASFEWDESKLDIEHEDWEWGLKWLRDNDLVPTGRAKPVRPK